MVNNSIYWQQLSIDELKVLSLIARNVIPISPLYIGFHLNLGLDSVNSLTFKLAKKKFIKRVSENYQLDINGHRLSFNMDLDNYWFSEFELTKLLRNRHGTRN